MNDEKMKDMQENKENFLSLANEVYPLMKQIKSAVEKYGFGNGSTYITISDNAYMNLHSSATAWEFNRFDYDKMPKIAFEYKEEFLLKES